MIVLSDNLGNHSKINIFSCVWATSLLFFQRSNKNLSLDMYVASKLAELWNDSETITTLRAHPLLALVPCTRLGHDYTSSPLLPLACTSLTGPEHMGLWSCLINRVHLIRSNIKPSLFSSCPDIVLLSSGIHVEEDGHRFFQSSLSSWVWPKFQAN